MVKINQWIGVALVAVLCCSAMPRQTHAQPSYAVGVCAIGMGLHWVGLTAEMKVYQPDSVELLRSLHVSVSYGAAILHASYVPVELRAVMFSGSSHLEAAVGASIQVEYSTWIPASSFKEVPSYGFVPGASLAYRYEADDGGFFVRVGLGALMYYNDNLVQGFVAQTIGFSF